jgi:tryptophan synthase alpha chain
VSGRRAGRIGAAFAAARAAGRPALIPFVTAGDPGLEATPDIVMSLARGGADIVELGVPFSDPIADGPVNQRAAERALKAGVTLDRVIGLAARLREEGAPPLVLFTYYNPIHRMGIAAFAEAARAAGVDGVLVTDLPPEEAGDLREALEGSGADLIFLLSPTSSRERIEMVARTGQGFVYFISRTGVTGVRDDLPEDLSAQVGRARSICPLPVAVGFGISRPEQVRKVASFADGVVIGSAVVRLIEETPDLAQLNGRLEAFCRRMSGR